jgi:hypothetical protein
MEPSVPGSSAVSGILLQYFKEGEFQLLGWFPFHSFQVTDLKRTFTVFFVVSPLFAASLALAQQSADETPAANPARPTVATPAALTPVGYLQFENGVLYASDSGEFASQTSINQVTKLTVSSRLQLLLLWEPFAHSKITGAQSSSDPGGVSAGIQGVLFPGEGKRPTVSASYIRSLYGGTAADIDIGSAKNTGIVLVSADLDGFHIDVNGLASEQSDAGIRRAQFGQTISVSHPLGPVTIGGELWHFSQPLIRGNAVGNLWCVSYALKKNLVADTGFNRGLTTTSTQWEGFAGFTYLLPRRLWRAN